jgi:flagellar biosynthesis protein FlhB
MSTERMVLIRRVATAIGMALMLIGLALIDLVLMLTIYGIAGLVFGVTLWRAWRRKRSKPPRSRTEQIEAMREFVHKQRRVDVLQAIFLIYLVGVLYWLDGPSASTLLFALGGVVLSAERLLVEPRIWAALSREQGFSLS